MLTSVQQPFVTVPASNIACQKTAVSFGNVLNKVEAKHIAYAGHDSSDISTTPTSDKKHLHLMG